MIYLQVGVARACVATIAAAVLLAGCASPTPAAESGASSSATATATATATPTPTPTPEPVPLLVISGTVADQQGQSLTITLTTTSVRIPTEDDRVDYAATRCAAEYPENDPFASPDTRVVTIAVDSAASAGFTGWTDDRGVLVAGSLFDGSIWEPEAHGAACYQDSRATRPGQGEVRLITSSTDWNVAEPVAGDGSITLAVYGFQAQTHNALGQPTGVGAVADCVTTASTEMDSLAAEVSAIHWGKQQNLPEYCFYARNAGD